MSAPDITDKLLHLGFKSCAEDANLFKSPMLDNLSIRLDESRLFVNHTRGAEAYQAVMSTHAALSNVHLENHVRGVVSTEFGAQTARTIKNFPYSEARMVKSGAKIPKLP